MALMGFRCAGVAVAAADDDETGHRTSWNTDWFEEVDGREEPVGTNHTRYR